ncbi:hypothetical protein EJ02DRAFT_457875 [Clathrospora elynae]|uniref:Retrotransposon gag domain-containing protein n=1 Tax=Clathrospora elynae TaxID=706981 RepID=A0A6A5SFQ9_9PLEO|nr:hypothetical protein EJ02DRAFT_457875 [Clathrospora elynae]
MRNQNSSTLTPNSNTTPPRLWTHCLTLILSLPKAWSKLDNLKQGKKKTFLSHFAEFQRLIADTGLNKAAQISLLRRSLSDVRGQAKDSRKAW